MKARAAFVKFFVLNTGLFLCQCDEWAAPPNNTPDALVFPEDRGVHREGGESDSPEKENDASVPDQGPEDTSLEDAGFDSGTDGGEDTGILRCGPSLTGKGGDMCDVPAGTFMMGCNEAVDDDCYDQEKPYHDVNLDEFKIDKFEVTVGEYAACVDAAVCALPSNGGTCATGFDGKENHPIACVNWDQAKLYCEWAGKRLPTEAEWEKAARGIDGRKYTWGNGPEASCDYAVMSDANAGGSGCGTGGTMPVGSKPRDASPYGAEDMMGNVFEWCADWWDPDYYVFSPSSDPEGPPDGIYRVVRGGSWRHPEISGTVRASDRGWLSPGNTDDNGGFRCAR